MKTNKGVNNVSNRFLPLSPSVQNHLENEPKISDFNILKDLGTGSFGRVILVQHKITKRLYAIKAIDKRNKTNIDGKPYFRREIEIMYKLHHPNIIHLYSHFEDEKNCYFIMEYAPNGNLYNYLSKRPNQSIELKLVALILRNLISAVYYLHTMNPPIIHRDIKPENVLLDEKNEIKLTDFGWSNYIHDYCDLRTTFCGTPIYLAPEIILNQGHDEHVDIWCIGVMLFELIVGRPPFAGKNRDSLMQNIVNMRISWPKTMDNDAKNLINRILKTNPKERISLLDIMKHPFITKYFSKPETYLFQENLERDCDPYIICKGISYKISNTPNVYLNKDIYIGNNNNNNNKETHTEKRNTNLLYKLNKREISPLPKTKLHLEKLGIVKVGKNNNNYKGGHGEEDNKEKINEEDSERNEKNTIRMHSRKKNSINIEKIQNENDNLTNSNNQLKIEAMKYKQELDEAFAYIQKLKEENRNLSRQIEEEKEAKNLVIQKLKSIEAKTSKEKLNQSNYSNNSSNNSRYTPQKIAKTSRGFNLVKKLNLNGIMSKSFDENNKGHQKNSEEELERIKTEMKLIKEKYENKITELNNENQKLQNEISNNKDNYRKMYENNKKYYENEIKKNKNKIKELEQLNSNYMLFKYK